MVDRSTVHSEHVLHTTLLLTAFRFLLPELDDIKGIPSIIHSICLSITYISGIRKWLAYY
jgi:hypothetical protein